MFSSLFVRPNATSNAVRHVGQRARGPFPKISFNLALSFKSHQHGATYPSHFRVFPAGWDVILLYRRMHFVRLMMMSLYLELLTCICNRVRWSHMWSCSNATSWMLSGCLPKLQGQGPRRIGWMRCYFSKCRLFVVLLYYWRDMRHSVPLNGCCDDKPRLLSTGYERKLFDKLYHNWTKLPRWTISQWNPYQKQGLYLSDWTIHVNVRRSAATKKFSIEHLQNRYKRANLAIQLQMLVGRRRIVCTRLPPTCILK